MPEQLIQASAIMRQHLDELNADAVCGYAAHDGVGANFANRKIEEHVEDASHRRRLRGADKKATQAQSFQARDAAPGAGLPGYEQP